jgi:hypothetical protein
MDHEIAPIDAHPERWICGKRTPTNPTAPEQIAHITLETVAIALAYQHRFLGMWGPASLARHQVRGADRLSEMGHPELRLAFLFHDVGEIVSGDIPKPFKPLVPALVAVEADWHRRLCTHLLGEEFGRETIELTRHPLVKAVDNWDYYIQLEGQDRQLKGLLHDLQYGGDAPEYPLADARDWLDAVLGEIKAWESAR